MQVIPRSAEVDKALKTVIGTIENALDSLNAQAGKLMMRGEYDKAEALARRGREIKAFIQEVETLRKQWKNLLRPARKVRPVKNEKTPLWSFYQPILQALEALGGEAKRQALMDEVEKIMAPVFKENDRDSMSGGRFQRWQVMVLRARKAMVQEGWVEAGGGLVWRITNAGRRAAKAELSRFMKS